ncbi:SPOR domain-containing protein [Leptospira ilyithenensis]|uniref:SPOR domain-containing protein n=1 Tax=Leptospira ilyithenensis TaxID=2484901 RepID=A0A4R9LRK1_9LEPT|nr:SPOR domain-containing protein [Leptospira ilyithenensis]TGN13438.1 SPOR domain-containing protein [Leptospira ilyithenensis]
MKERVFYVINLDKQRIGVLSLFLFALFFSFFFLGVSVGKGRLESAPSQNLQPKTIVSENTESKTPEGLQTEESIPAPSTQELALKGSKTKEIATNSGNLEVPMADVGNTTNPYYAESSTAKDEEDERKAQVVDLTKSSRVSKQETKKNEILLKNQAPHRPSLSKKEKGISEKAKKVSKRTEFASPQGKLYTVQLGAFGTRDSAESFLSKLISDNKGKLSSNPFIIYKNGYFVVQMGKTNNKEGLRRQLSKLILAADVKSKAMIVSFVPLSRS